MNDFHVTEIKIIASFMDSNIQSKDTLEKYDNKDLLNKTDL